MTRGSLAVVVLATTSACGAQPMVHSPGAAEVVELVEHVDVLPDHAAQAKAAVSKYIEAARREPGALRIDAMQEMRLNHFDLIEVWRDEAAYRAHESTPATLLFRNVIGPWLGSPRDTRMGTPITR